MTPRRVAVPAITLLALGALAACDAGVPSEPESATTTPIAAAKPAVEPVCHFDADAGAYVRLDLVERAAAGHRGHGDAAPGEPAPGVEGYAFDDACGLVVIPVAELEQLTPVAAVYETGAFTGSGAGEVTGNVIPVDINLFGDRASTSACEPADFAGLDFSGPNDIALVQRGTCFFGDKAANASAAGAEAVVIFNQGNTPEREGLIVGTAATLGDGSTVSHAIPVVGASFAAGAALAEPGSTARVRVVLTD